MPEPISTSTLLAAAGVTVGGNVLETVLDRWLNANFYRLRDQILQQRIEYNAELQRRARGKFTDRELMAIRMASEPYINQVAEDVDARGLGLSAAGLAEVNRARYRPITFAQQQAASEYAGSLEGLDRATAARMPQDTSIGDDLMAIAKSYAYLQGKNKDMTQLDRDAGEVFGKGQAAGKKKSQGYQAPDSHFGNV